jgi:cell division protein FtsB
MTPDEIERRMDFILESQANSVVRMDRLEENMSRLEVNMDRFEARNEKLQAQIDTLREASRDLLRVSRRLLESSPDHSKRIGKLGAKDS